jgi:hypothetical protein
MGYRAVEEGLMLVNPFGIPSAENTKGRNRKPELLVILQLNRSDQSLTLSLQPAGQTGKIITRDELSKLFSLVVTDRQALR